MDEGRTAQIRAGAARSLNSRHVSLDLLSARLVEDREKQSAALTSLIAAVGLTAFKIVVGVLTGSLGILAEAAHSGLDLVAALMTFLAVRISGRPPDRTHLYGHGKVENLSALFETLLLLAHLRRGSCGKPSTG